MKNFVLGFFCIIMLGCVTTSQIVRDTHEIILTPESARIYVLRPSILGTATGMKVYANDNYIGKTGVRSYVCFDVAEGEYIIKSSAENTDRFTVNAKAGRTYFLKQISKPGIVANRLSLELLQEAEGQALVSKMNRPKVKFTE